MPYTPIDKNTSSTVKPSRYTPVAENPDAKKPVPTMAVSGKENEPEQIKTSFWDPTANVRVRDVLRETPGATKKVLAGVADFGGDIFHGMTRTIGRTQLSVIRGLNKTPIGTGKDEEVSFQTGTNRPFWENFVVGAIFGDEPVKDWATTIAEGEIKTREFGKKTQEKAKTEYKPETLLEKASVGAMAGVGKFLEKQAFATSALGIPIIGALDFVGGGGSAGKTAVVKALSKADEISDAVKIFKKMGLADDFAIPLSEVVSKTKNEAYIGRILDKVDELQATTKKAVGVSGDDILKAVSRTPDDTLHLVRNIDEGVKEIVAKYSGKTSKSSPRALSDINDYRRVLTREAEELLVAGNKEASDLITNTVVKRLDEIADQMSSVSDLFKSKDPNDVSRILNQRTTDETVNKVVKGEMEDLRLVSDSQIKQTVDAGLLPKGITPDDTVDIYRWANDEIGPANHVSLSESGIIEKYSGKRTGELQKLSVPVRDLIKSKGTGDEFIYMPESVVKSPELAAALGRTPIHSILAPGTDLSAELKALLPETVGSESSQEISTLSKLSRSLDSTSLADNTTEKKILQEADQKLVLTSPELSDPTIYQKAKGVLDSKSTKFVETVQDSWIRVKKLTDKQGVNKGKITMYEKKQLMTGKVRFQTEQVYEKVKSIKEDILKTSTKMGIKDTDLAYDIDNYLIARHAPERNKKVGEMAAGMSDADAAKIVANTPAEAKRIAESLQEMANETLDILRRGRVISDELYTELRETYKYHIPLNRVMDESDDFSDILRTKGMDVFGSGLKRAKGSKLEIDDVTSNIMTNLNAAIIRAEKNVVDLETLKFFRQNPDITDVKITKNPLAVKNNDPRVLTLMEDGKRVFIQIKDPALASALRGINEQHLPDALNFITSFTRLYSGIHTKFNVAFPFSNIFRDTQEMMVYVAAQKNMGGRSSIRVLKNNPESIKTITDYFRGVDSPNVKLYRQMVEDGAGGGGFAVAGTRKEVKFDIGAIEAELKSKPKQAFKKLIKGIENWNTIFEDSNRFSVYKEAIEKGLSREEAAILAKEATINFDRRGTAGPIINSLYMFSNASIQGSAKMLKAMRNPKVAATTIGAVTTSVFATSQWNDRVDPDWRKKVTKWDRNANLVVVLPSEKFSYLTIPVSWGLKPIKVASDYLYDFSLSNDAPSFKDAATGIAAAVLEGYNPIGGSSLTQILTPTMLDPFVDTYANKAWHGGQIKPDWDKNAPASTQYYKSLEQELPGRIAIKTTAGLSDLGIIEISPASMEYVFQQMIGGAGQTMSQTVDTITTAAQGEVPMARQVPIMSRFLKSKTEEEVEAGIFREGTASAISEQSIEKAKLTRRANKWYDEVVLKQPEDVIQDKWADLVRTDPELAQKISTISKERALDLKPHEKSLMALNVKNGARAERIAEMYAGVSPQEGDKLVQDLVNKKVITKEVARQLSEIWATQQPQATP